MSNRTTQIIESLNKLYDLMPDGIINFEVRYRSHRLSNENMCLSLVVDLGLHDALLDGIDSTRNSRKRSIRTQSTLSVRESVRCMGPSSHAFRRRKMFDPDPYMCPSSLTRDQLYNFITDRFQSPAPASVQEQALQWLQILCSIDIFIPVPLLIQIFITGINSLQKLESRAQRREHYTMAGSSSNEQSVENGLNLMLLSQDDTNATSAPSALAGLTTVSSASSANKFLVFDTYETYRAHRHQLMLQQMTGQEMVSIIKEEEEEFIINESETNSTCCIMMIDMGLKQVASFAISSFLMPRPMTFTDGAATDTATSGNVQSSVERDSLVDE